MQAVSFPARPQSGRHGLHSYRCMHECVGDLIGKTGRQCGGFLPGGEDASAWMLMYCVSEIILASRAVVEHMFGYRTLTHRVFSYCVACTVNEVERREPATQTAAHHWTHSLR